MVSIFSDASRKNTIVKTNMMLPAKRKYNFRLRFLIMADGYLYLAIVKEKSGITAFSSTVMHYFLIWLLVFMIVLFVSVLIIRQAMKPTVKTMQSQKNFIAAVSHELKTPLAVLLSTADAIESSPDCTPNIKNDVSF